MSGAQPPGGAGPRPVDQLLSQAVESPSPPLADSSSSRTPSAAAIDVANDSPVGGDGSGPFDGASIEELLRQANFEDASMIDGPPGGAEMPSGFGAPMPMPDAPAFKLPDFNQVLRDAQVSSIDLLRDVELNVKIELGRARMLVEDVLKLSEGSVVELDKLAGDPVDVFVNERLVARGEVLVLNDNFCVRVNEIIAGAKEEGL